MSTLNGIVLILILLKYDFDVFWSFTTYNKQEA